MRHHRLCVSATLLFLIHQLPVQAQEVPAKPAAQSSAETTKKPPPDTIDKSWPELACATPEARERRRYTMKTWPNRRDTTKQDTAWTNQNGLIEDQQELADILACERGRGFVLRTGVDFSSADGFVGKNADLRASIGYTINFGGRWLRVGNHYRVARFATTVRAERLSALVARSYFGCSGGVEPWSRGGSGEQPLRLPEHCARSVVAADSATQTVYRTSPLPFRPDDHAVQGTWNVSALTLFETALWSSTQVLVGPALSLSFSTDPTSGTDRGLATSVQGGFSVRQIGKSGFERFSVLAMWGRLYQFRQAVVAYDSTFVGLHPEVALMPGSKAVGDGVLVEVGRNPRANVGMSVQMMFQPLPKGLPNLYLRGAGDFPYNGHRSASLAVLLQGDLGSLLKGIGITTTSSTTQSGEEEQ
jgi:hypothetical protein